MRAALQRAWLRRGPLACALWPVSLLLRAVVAARHAAFRAGWLRTERVPVPVVVIGNLVAGGAGKTPVVMAVVEHLRQRGLACGVVSRGYGREGDACLAVTADSDPALVGDEPLLVARRCQVPVVVGRDRAQAARALLHAHPATQVVVSDDGLQHLALGRDIEVLVFDDRGLGNGWLLPAGPLREPWPRRADLVLRTPAAPGVPGHQVVRRLDTHARRHDGARAALAELAARPCVAVAGIANPEAFFAMLRRAGIVPVRTLALPDHDAFTGGLPALPADAALLCTEKDAVKLWRTHPHAWAVPLAVTIEPAFWTALDRLLDATLSSAHGPQTA